MNRLLRVLATSCVACLGVNAAIVTTFEAAGVQHTTVGGTIEEGFEAAPVGVFFGPTVAGTFSAGGERVKASDIYGSSNKYLDIGLYGTGAVTAGAPPFTYTVTFGAAINYFGFYWAAVDGDDKVEFFNGAALVGTYNSTLFAALPAGYWKVNGAEVPPTTTEPYAFVNFLGLAGTSFDSVKFTNGGPGTGFETDNYTVLLDGTVRQFDVPEPATFGLAGLSLALLAYGIRKRAIA